MHVRSVLSHCRVKRVKYDDDDEGITDGLQMLREVRGM